jgi:hypothetical protein
MPIINVLNTDKCFRSGSKVVHARLLKILAVLAESGFKLTLAEDWIGQPCTVNVIFR